MPLVRIDLDKSFSSNEIKGISEGVYEALLSIGVPKDDKFQIINTHSSDTLVYSRTYLGNRTDRFVLVHIFWNMGRTIEQKKNLYAAIAENLSRVGVKKEDVFVNLTEVAKENWSFGNGIAQY